MLAFAANSLLNRLAVDSGLIGAVEFATIRVAAGAVFLLIVYRCRNGCLSLMTPKRPLGVIALVTYMLGFSVAYTNMDAGVGALMLFGCVNLTMFGGSFLSGSKPMPIQYLSAAIAFAGLVWLMWPEGDATMPLVSTGCMILAGIGWGFYSILGKADTNPLGATTANFVLAVPICLVLGLYFPHGIEVVPTQTKGVILAMIAGAITSGLGYSLWYFVLPKIGTATAGIVQLSVPVLTVLGAAMLLNEPLTLKNTLAGFLVLFAISIPALHATAQGTMSSKSS